jgi:2-keto-4-pentenoate hydratase/2-oxohepta-3-ene-1,7-dioic acid hydratase in catechol pathway
MRIVLTGDDRIGALTDGGMVDVSSVFQDVNYRTAADRMPRVMGLVNERRDRLDEMVRDGTVEPVPALQAPVPRPPKLIAAFGNYREGWDRERQPQDMFLESPDSVLAPNGTADESALDVLAGYTCAMDVSARGIGRVGPSRIGKSFDTFTPLGPAVVTTDEVPDPQNLRVTLRVNGEQRQQYTTADMEYSVVEILAYISGFMTLVPGDVIMCGTQHQGLGAMQDGDHVEMTIEGIGSLAVDVRDPLKREWPRGVDEDMAARQRSVGRS